MARKLLRTSALATFALAVVALSYGAFSTAAAAEKLGLEDIMKKSFNKKVGVCPKIGPAAKEGKWDDAQKLSKELAELGAALPSTDCPKGDKASWAKLTKEFAVQTKAIADAAAKKDGAATEAALKTLGGSCKACHTAHRD
jgi:cytochrome c556